MEYICTVLSCFGRVVDPNAIVQHVKYPFTAGGNTGALESAIEELQAQKLDVVTRIENAEREDSTPTNQALQWVAQVEKIKAEANEIQQKYQQLCRCLCNICPNVWSIYKISKMAANKLVEVNEWRGKKPENVTERRLAPLAPEIPASSSISPTLESALHYVKDDVHNIIGIWGMGGIGKTHLLEQINNKLSGDSEFKVVVFVKCTKEFSEENIQNEIIGKLALEDGRDKQSMIFNFLRGKSFVLLLDNLWGPVDLKRIGIPDIKSKGGTCKQKVVLTTRSIYICGQMEVEQRIEIQLLNFNDSWSLFKKKVNEETISHPYVENLARDVVEKLGGLPLAIIIVGRAMYGKKDLSQWDHAVQQLGQESVHEESVLQILKFSYDNLSDETLKSCFLHCSLWPENFQILKDELVELWMGLGLIDEPEIQAAYNAGYRYIGDLRAASLLEVDDDERFIKMHDMIREMALWITRGKWIVQAGTNTNPVRINISTGTEKISAMKIGATNFSFSTNPSSPKPSTLLLSHNHLNNSIILPLELFSLLTILDLSHNKLNSLPDGICTLVHLQFLNLSFNPLQSLPEQLGDLTKLKYLLLRGLECVLPKGVLSKLDALKVLDLSNYCSKIVDDNLKMKIFSILEEVKRTPFFQALGISILDMDDMAEFCGKVSVPVRWLDIGYYKGNCLSFSNSFFGNPQFKNLFWIDIKETMAVQQVEFECTSQSRNSCCINRLEYLQFRKMPRMEKVIWKKLEPKDVFPRLQVLEFEMCDALRSISWVLNLQCIQELRVIRCPAIKQLICIDEQQNEGITVSKDPVPLKKMHLGENSSLEEICDPTVITFPGLEILEVYGCEQLKKLPFNTGNPPETLKKIRGSGNWWNNVVMGEGSHRSSLQHFFEQFGW